MKEKLGYSVAAPSLASSCFRWILAGFLLVLLLPTAYGQLSVNPGDQGGLVFGVSNSTDSAGAMNGVQISIDAPQGFNVTNVSGTDSITISTGQTHYFLFHYSIDNTAPVDTSNINLSVVVNSSEYLSVPVPQVWTIPLNNGGVAGIPAAPQYPDYPVY